MLRIGFWGYTYYSIIVTRKPQTSIDNYLCPCILHLHTATTEHATARTDRCGSCCRLLDALLQRGATKRQRGVWAVGFGALRALSSGFAGYVLRVAAVRAAKGVS